jgi:putative membrane protein
VQSNGDHRIAKGMLAGLIGGLAGALAMNQFQAVSRNVKDVWKHSAHQPEKPQPEGRSEEDDATMKTADRIAVLVTDRHLTREQKEAAGPCVHYVFGALVGAVYGALAEMAPVVTKAGGTAYGTAVWLGGDEIGVAMLGLAAPPTEYPLSVHANAFASHLVYGASLDLVRKGIRAIV